MPQQVAEVLRPAFLTALKREANKYSKATRQASKKQWVIARLVNKEWAYVDHKFENEINKDYWLTLVSAELNQSLPFPIVSDSGETLRRWCNVAASYANADISHLEGKLSFDHFRVARTLSELPKNAKTTPIEILERALDEKWIVAQMVEHYGEKEIPTDFDKAVGSLDSLQSIKWDFIKSLADREEIQRLASRIRFLLERNLAIA